MIFIVPNDIADIKFLFKPRGVQVGRKYLSDFQPVRLGDYVT